MTNGSRSEVTYYTIRLLFLSFLFSFSGWSQAEAVREYIDPTIEVVSGSSKKLYRVDWCLHWARDCGQPAADAFCRRMGGKMGATVVSWTQEKNIGSQSHTYVMGDKKVCREAFCDGFRTITCKLGLE